MNDRSLLVNALNQIILALLLLSATHALAQTDETDDRPDLEAGSEPAAPVDLSATVRPAADTEPAADTKPAVDSEPADAAEATQTVLIEESREAVQKKLTIDDLRALIDQQQQQLQQQSDHINQQQKLLSDQQSNMKAQQQEINDQAILLITVQTQIDQLAADDTARSLTEEDVRLRERLEAIESQVAKVDEDPENIQDTLDFPGSIRIPGTNAAYRVGGFVKMSMVDSFDAIGSDDRFIVSSIPTNPVLKTGEVVVTARQSRTNFDLREKTSLGVFRAFVEGDFAADNDTYRLRHAYGQYGPILTGKTWSTFVDIQASPEEIDFEGINGRINVRQPQIRWFPKIGESWNLLIGLEDPDVDVEDGAGVSERPDFVASIRRTYWNRWHIKSSVLLRQIQAESITNPMGKEDEFGWGVSLSGRTGVPWLNENDNFMFQLNYGDGLGRYVNDLSSEGGRDAVFDPADGSLETLDVFAGYLAFQHWWTARMRSNVVYSWVNMGNHSFQPGSDLENTARSTVNWLWSPIPRVDLGVEFLWGRREDRNGDKGIAKQLQVSTTYRF